MVTRALRSSPEAFAVMLLAALATLALVACGASGTVATSSTSSTPGQAAASPTVATSPGPSGIPLPTPTVAGTIAFSHNVGEDAFYNANFDVCVVNTDGTGLKTLAGGAGCQYFPRWSPDGSKILYMESVPGDNNPQNLWVVNADGSGKAQITNGTNSPMRSRTADWSPDGTQIVLSSWLTDIPQERAVVAVMDADGSHFRRVTKPDGASVDYWPSWESDGRIYFYRPNTTGGPAYEYSVKPDGSGLTRIMRLGSDKRYVYYGLSPDARRVAMEDLKTRRLQVASVGGGKRATLLAPVPDYLGDAAAAVSWSPDQKALAIAGFFDTGNYTRLYIVNADGTGLSAVPGVASAKDPAWRPE
jgi:Tol biopolymer transport system component